MKKSLIFFLTCIGLFSVAKDNFVNKTEFQLVKEKINNVEKIFSNNLNIKRKQQQSRFTIYDSTNEVIHKYKNQLIKLFGSDDKLDEKIEFAREVVIPNTNEKVAYVDFYGKNGYAVFDKNVFYEFEIDKDISILRSLDNFYYEKEGQFVVFENGSYSSIYETEDFDCSYNGHIGTNNADLNIYDIDAYVKDRYGSDWKFSESYIIDYYQWVSQLETSYYRYENLLTGQHHSEANCVINAMYSAISNFASGRDDYGNIRYYYINLISDLSKVSVVNDIENDPFYKNNVFKDTDDFEFSKPSHWILNSNSFSLSSFNKTYPKMYAELRKLGVQKGYVPSVGLSENKIENIMETYFKNRGYNIDCYQTDSHSEFKQNINLNIPCIITSRGSQSLSSPHCMGFYGYATYYRDYKILWGIPKRDIRDFYVVDSGHGVPPSEKSKFLTSNGYVMYFDNSQNKKLLFNLINRTSV